MTFQAHEFNGGALYILIQMGDLENVKFITPNSESYQKT